VVFAQKNEQSSANLQGILTFDSSNTTVSTGNAFADLLLGNIAQYQQWNLEPKYYNRYRIVEPYFQDDWRATKRLTLKPWPTSSAFTAPTGSGTDMPLPLKPNVYSSASAPTVDADGSLTPFQGSLVPGSGNPFNGIIQCGGPGGTFPVDGFPNASAGSSSNAGCLKGHLFKPRTAPRIRFRSQRQRQDGHPWRLWNLLRTQPMATKGTPSRWKALPHLRSMRRNSTSLDMEASVAAAELFPFFPLSVTSIPSKAIWPYVQQWHLDVQSELPGHFVATVFLRWQQRDALDAAAQY